MEKEDLAPIAADVLTRIGGGLVNGKGDGTRGNMCVQQAVTLALGEYTHYVREIQQEPSDEPTCVHKDVRGIGIELNDEEWSSNAKRAQGLRRFAIAQLGTDTPDFDADKFEDESGAILRRTIEAIKDAEYGDALDAALAVRANALADLLESMKTPGSELLCMLEWPKADLLEMARANRKRVKKVNPDAIT